MGLVVAAGLASLAVMTKALNVIDVSLIQFYYGLVSCVMIVCYMTVAALTSDYVPFRGIRWSTWLLLVATSLLNLISMVFMILCNQRGQPATVGVL